MTYLDRFPPGMIADAKRLGAITIAPDSAEALPAAVWEVDPEILHAAVERYNAGPGFCRVTPEARQYLTSVGGAAIGPMLEQFDALAARLG